MIRVVIGSAQKGGNSLSQKEAYHKAAKDLEDKLNAANVSHVSAVTVQENGDELLLIAAGEAFYAEVKEAKADIVSKKGGK